VIVEAKALLQNSLLRLFKKGVTDKFPAALPEAAPRT
jgi:hypothetical protein